MNFYRVAAICSAGVFIMASCTSYSEREIPIEQRVRDAEYLVIDKDVYLKDRAGPVLFTHDMHYDSYGIDCEACHHLYEDGKNVWTPDDSVDTCESCHDPVSGSEGVYRLETAFHKNCKGCHKEITEGEKVPSAPMLCQGCHETQPEH